MEILTDKIKDTKFLLDSLKSTYNNIVKLVYEESWNKYNSKPDLEDLFRWALSLVESHYISKYNQYSFTKNLIYKSNEYARHYNIYKRDSNWRNGSEQVGKVCYLKDLSSVINWKDLWIYNVKNNNYIDSLEQFEMKYKHNCYDLFLKYVQREKKGTLYLINDKKLKLKNIVIYLF